MALIVKGIRKKDKREGIRLQKKANFMLLSGNTGDEYDKVRRVAEWHLGIWDWQKTVPKWKLPALVDENFLPLKEFTPYYCTHIVKGSKEHTCPHLPAGGSICKSSECPSEL
jgi:hypothetical protein